MIRIHCNADPYNADPYTADPGDKNNKDHLQRKFETSCEQILRNLRTTKMYFCSDCIFI